MGLRKTGSDQTSGITETEKEPEGIRREGGLVEPQGRRVPANETHELRPEDATDIIRGEN